VSMPSGPGRPRTRITTSTRPSPTTRSAPWPTTSAAARDRGPAGSSAWPTTCARASPWVPDFVAAVRELRPVPGLEVLGRGGSQDPQRGPGKLEPARVTPRGGPGADRGPPVPRRLRARSRRRTCGTPWSAASAQRPTCSTASSRRPSGALQRDRPAAAGPPVQPAAQDGPGRGGTCPARPLDHLAQGCYRAGARVGSQREVGLPVPRGRSGPWPRPGVPPGGQHRQPRLRGPSGRYARVRGDPRGGAGHPGALMGVVVDVLDWVLVLFVMVGAVPMLAAAYQYLLVTVHFRRKPLPGPAPRISRAPPSWCRPGTRPRSSAHRSTGSCSSTTRPRRCGCSWWTTPALMTPPTSSRPRAVQYPGQVVHLRRDKGGEGKSHTLNHGLRTILGDDWMQAAAHHGRRRDLRAGFAAHDDPSTWADSRVGAVHRLHQGRQPPGPTT